MKYPCQAKRQKWLHDEHMCTFTYWLQQNVLKWYLILLYSLHSWLTMLIINITYLYMLRLPLVIKNLYRKPFNGQLMVLATMCLSIIAMSLMGVTTIHRSMMIFELPKIVESTLQLQQCKFLASRIKIQYLVSFVSMGLLLRFETLIIPCSRFQSSSVIGLIVRMESKLMILGLPQLTSTKQLINQILSFQPPRLSKFSMYKMVGCFINSSTRLLGKGRG